MSLSAIFFDLDGTLLDTAPDFIAAINHLTAENNLPPIPSNLIRQNVSRGGRALTELTYGISRESEEFERYYQRLLSIYEEHMGQHSVLFDGMATLLKQIEKYGLDWGIITNKPARFAEPLMADINLPSRPQLLLCPDHVSNPKPDPESLLLACKTLNHQPKDVLYIGDHSRDIECGRDAGCLTMAVAYGYLHQEDNIEEWNADFICETGHDIWPVVQTLL